MAGWHFGVFKVFLNMSGTDVFIFNIVYFYCLFLEKNKTYGLKIMLFHNERNMCEIINFLEMTSVFLSVRKYHLSQPYNLLLTNALSR